MDTGRLKFSAVTAVAMIVSLGCLLPCKVSVGGEDNGHIEASRPGDQNKPTDVLFFVYVVDISDIDDVGQTFEVNAYVRLTWTDERLAHEKGKILMPLSKIWNPRVIIANQGGLVRSSLPEVGKVDPNGTVVYHQRYVGTISQPLKLSEFPFDEHLFTMHMVSVGNTPRQVRFLPDSPLTGNGDGSVIGGLLGTDLSLQDWGIVDYHAKELPIRPLPEIEAAGFAFQFTARRQRLYYICQIIIPLVLIVMMSWVAFYVDPTSASIQIGVATSTIVTLIAYRFMLGNLIPRLPYMTRLDFFTLGSTVL
ncbi:MAG: hypothetical protein ACYS8Z_19495, partial [Planctomycetota bacterium]